MAQSCFKSLALTIALFLAVVVSSAAQSLPFSPITTNWTVEEYHAARQNWSVSQAPDGIVYVGNNMGLLEFDGCRWTRHNIPTSNCVRSVLAVDGRVYVGSYREFGYFDINTWAYVSLSASLADGYPDDDDIWNILAYDNQIIFQSFSRYYVYDGESVRVSQQMWPLNLFKVGGRLYSQLLYGGMVSLKLVDGALVQDRLFDNTQFGSSPIVSFMDYGNSCILILTEDAGLYVFDGESFTELETDFESRLRQEKFNRGAATGDGHFILGSVSGGVIECDRDGRLQWSVDTSSGLNNNTVLGLLVGSDGNVWAALDDGVSYVMRNFDIFVYKPHQKNVGMVYGLMVEEDMLYLATNQGSFVFSNSEEKRISHDNEQTWFLEKIGGHILRGSNLSLYKVSSSFEESIGPRDGAYCVKRVFHQSGKEYLFEGGYSALHIYEHMPDDSFRYLRSFDNASLIHNIETDGLGYVWCENARKGITRLKLSDDFRKVDDAVHYSSLGEVNDSTFTVFKIDGRVCFSNGRQFYTYDDIEDEIVPYSQMNNSLVPTIRNVHQVCKAGQSFYWFLTDKAAFVVQASNSDYSIVRKIPYSAFGDWSEDRSSMFYDYAHDKSYLCLDNKIVQVSSYVELDTGQTRHLELKSITASNNKGRTASVDVASAHVKRGYNSLHFSFMFPVYDSPEMYLRTRLVGLSDEWDDISSGMEIEYDRLKPGKYCLEAQVSDSVGTLANDSFTFRITRPFAGSLLMMLVYLLIFTGLVILCQNRLSTVFEKAKNYSEVHNEKSALEAELKEKSRELASMVAKGITTDEKSWEIFKSQFDMLEDHFFEKLTAAYPSLTSADLRFCSLLRLNLTTKEIAGMLNLTSRGVESARYRIRKKFALGPDDSLSAFIISITSTPENDKKVPPTLKP